MLKSILAISEGGPDAAMSFRLAVRIAAMFEGTVDALHYSEARRHDADITVQSMPFLAPVARARISERAKESQRAWNEVARVAGGELTSIEGVTLDQVVRLARFSNLLVIGRPGSDADNIAPETVKAALYDCARPVVIAPPHLDNRPLASVLVAWNGSLQAARAVDYAMPFLEKAEKVTIVIADEKPEAVNTPHLLRTLDRHGVQAAVETVDHGDVSGRARGRALIGHARKGHADLLVMGAYGHGGLSNFLGLGGATAKVISSCPMPLLLAH